MSKHAVEKKLEIVYNIRVNLKYRGEIMDGKLLILCDEMPGTHSDGHKE